MNGALPKTVLIVGSGGREHALVQACLRSPTAPRVLAAPGNAGISRDVPCHPVAVDDIPGLVALAKREGAGFVVVGPEVPLSLGLVDALGAAGIPAVTSVTWIFRVQASPFRAGLARVSLVGPGWAAGGCTV